MLASHMWLVQQCYIEELDKSGEFKEDPPHIYMIARQPRVLLDPHSFKINDNLMKVCFKVQQEDTFKVGELRLFLPPDTPKLYLDCSYPYTEFSLKDQQGVEFGRYKVVLLLAQTNSLYSDLSELLSLEILYVGQSYGTEGARTAAERLQKHSTLQNIYSESIKRSPDKEIWLLLFSFDQVQIVTIDPKQPIYEVSLEDNNKHIQKAINTEITEQQRINFTEAALIRYFQPEYNEMFKNNFPSPAHKTYSECYDLDLNTVMVELQTKEIGFMLRSAKVPPKWDHFVIFPLHSQEERKSMFELAGLIESEKP
jgi:hypothetical protein